MPESEPPRLFVVNSLAACAAARTELRAALFRVLIRLADQLPLKLQAHLFQQKSPYMVMTIVRGSLPRVGEVIFGKIDVVQRSARQSGSCYLFRERFNGLLPRS